MKRSAFGAYLRETGEKILYLTLTFGALVLGTAILMVIIGLIAWIMGTPDWGGVFEQSMYGAIFWSALWVLFVPYVVIATIPAVPWVGRRLRASIRRSKDRRRLDSYRSVEGGGTANLRDLAALGSLGRAGRSAVYQALRPPPPPIRQTKPRWLGLTLRSFGRFFDGFGSMLWKSASFIVAFVLGWPVVFEDLLPKEWTLNILGWGFIPIALLVSVLAGIYRARYGYPSVPDPLLLVGAVKAWDGAPAGQQYDPGAKELVVRAHYDRPSREEIEVGVRSALELHADGSLSPCPEFRGERRVKCTPAGARSMLDLEHVVLICQREPFSELSLVGRFAHFAARTGLYP